MPEEQWKPPTEFDLVKELNAQAARLATLLALLLTATVFIAGSPKLREVVQAGNLDAQLALLALALVLDLIGALLDVMYAMQPAVLLDPLATQQAWRDFVSEKGKLCEEAGTCLLAAAITLAVIGLFGAYAADGTLVNRTLATLATCAIVGFSLGAALKSTRVLQARQPRWLAWLVSRRRRS